MKDFPRARANYGPIQFCQACGKRLGEGDWQGFVEDGPEDLELSVACVACWDGASRLERLQMVAKKCRYHDMPEWWPVLAAAVWSGK